MEYWGGEKGYAFNSYVTRREVNANAMPGDFIGYMKNDTYTIWHVVFVHSKKNGKIYVSQHTANRLNEKGNSVEQKKISRKQWLYITIFILICIIGHMNPTAVIGVIFLLLSNYSDDTKMILNTGWTSSSRGYDYYEALFEQVNDKEALSFE